MSHDAHKAIPVSHPVIPLLAERWSPRAFDPGYSISEPELASLLEAARTAPSAFNSQARRFVFGRSGTPGFDRIHAGLTPRNQAWAVRASLLIVNIAVRHDDEAEYRWAEYDLGQAVAHLSIQAQAMGLSTHQVGGIDPELLTETFALREGWVPMSVTVVGRRGDVDVLPEPLRTWESGPRTRLDLDELVREA